MAETLSYFALLGVGEDVSQGELEARYQELAEHLTSPAIPAHLREWARRQAALVDEAYAVLSDPERRASVHREQQAPAAPARQTADDRDSAQNPPERDAELRKEPPEGAEPDPETDRASPRPERPQSRIFHALLGFRRRPLFLGVLIGLHILGVILLGRYGLPWSGSGEATPEPEQAGTLVPLDTERIAQLMEAAQQDPNDPEVLFELGETFFQANEWQSSIDWFTRLLVVDPGNVHARTDVGTANFNLGNFEEAEAAWLAVLEIDPNDVQTHYNLGFVYANTEPQDIVSARREWQIVVSLAPDSELASIAQAHLDGMPEGVAGEETPPAPPEEAGDAGETD